MTRTENIKRNLIFNTLKFVVQLILQFVLRTILIYQMGAEYLGLNGLFTNIFAFLNLTELGIGSAIVFSMYKPIADNDIEKVKTLQNLYKKFYTFLFFLVLVMGLIVTYFLDVFIKEDLTVDINIYFLFILYLINTLVGYLSAHKRSLLFAYQRNDIENKVRTICIFLMTIVQIGVLVAFKNYYIYYAITILFTIIECILVHKAANKYFPEINGPSLPLEKTTKKELVKNISALSMHKVGGLVVSSTDNILISTFLGIAVVGAYSNYVLITSSLLSLFALFINALTGSVGNLVAKNNSEYVYEKFKTVNFMFVYLTSFCTICLVVLFQPFIKLWTGGGAYLLDFSTVLLCCLSFYLMKMRSAVLIFKDCAGLFWKDRFKPLLEAIVNLIVSIILVQYYGINGIFIGTIVSTLVAPFWIEPYVLYKNYFKKSLFEYFKRYFLDSIIMIGCCILCYFVCSFIPDGGIWWLILKFVVCIGLSNILLLLAYSPTKELKDMIAIGKNMMKNFIKK